MFDIIAPEMTNHRESFMRSKMPTQMLAILLFACLCLPSICLAWQGVVTEVLDGDTIRVAAQGDKKSQISIRMYGIDAPEKDQEGGGEATEYLCSILPNRAKVEIVPMSGDKYGRNVGLVMYKRQNINLKMLEAGQAWHYAKYCKAAFCREWAKVQRKAQKSKRGLWKQKRPTPPWQWRRG